MDDNVSSSTSSSSSTYPSPSTFLTTLEVNLCTQSTHSPPTAGNWKPNKLLCCHKMHPIFWEHFEEIPKYRFIKRRNSSREKRLANFQFSPKSFPVICRRSIKSFRLKRGINKIKYEWPKEALVLPGERKRGRDSRKIGFTVCRAPNTVPWVQNTVQKSDKSFLLCFTLSPKHCDILTNTLQLVCQLVLHLLW